MRGAGRARSRRRPRRTFRITREGRVFVLVALGVGMGAVNTGNNLLYLVLGLMLSMLLVSGVLSDLVLIGLRVTRVAPRRLHAGRPAAFELVIRNEKRVLPSLSIELADIAEGEGESAPAYVLRVSPRATESCVLRRSPARRGPLRLTDVVLRTRYPFGLIEKGRVLAVPEELLVYPALVPVRADALERMESGQELPSRRAGQGAEVSGVRAYRQGDEARDVHWRKSASRGVLVVRERERDARATIALELDDRRPASADDAWDAAFERTISEVASLAEAAHARSLGVEVITATGRSPRVSPGDPLDPLHRFLALLEPSAEELAAPSSRAASR